MKARQWLITAAALALVVVGPVVGVSPATAAPAEPFAATLPGGAQASGGGTITFTAARPGPDGAAAAQQQGRCTLIVGRPFQTGNDVNVAATVGCNFAVRKLEMTLAIYKNFFIATQNSFAVDNSPNLLGNAATGCGGLTTNNYQGGATVRITELNGIVGVIPATFGPAVNLLCTI